MRLVLDTNVLVSAILNPVGAPAGVMNIILSGKAILLYDNRILFEYRDVLRRQRFGFPEKTLEPIFEFISGNGQYVTAEPTPKRFQDEDDKPFYEVAESGNASYLVTGNPKRFPKDSIVVSPREFVDSWPDSAK